MDNEHTDHTYGGIAVVGMAGRFPGASTIDALWQNLIAGKETITHFSDEELAAVEYDYASVKDDPGYVKARGILKDVDRFDAPFFGFSPREAATIDPQQRVWFECAWEALEDACYDPDTFDGLIGVFGGSGYLPTYLIHNLCANREYIERLVRMRAIDAFQAVVGNDKDYLPTRTSFKLNLRGPSVNVQTACSTSLVAIAQACQSLMHYESDMCLAGAVSIQFPQERGYVTQEGGMESPDGHCRVFDARAGGTVFGHGVGIVVLRRLEDALAEGDHIYAVIKGWAMNNDGAGKVSYVAPSVDGQAEVIAVAQAMADVDPGSITYVEAHGTATRMGDPIEVAALTKAFRIKTAARQYCGIGSIKSNIGHLDAACGVAGLIKTVLALQHEQIPPTVNFEAPNPNIDFENSPFYVVSKTQAWKAGDAPRRAGVSSFGVGGTNVHLVVEEAPAAQPDTASRPYHLLPLSAKTKTALEARTRDLLGYLEQEETVALADVAYSLQRGRQAMKHRQFLVCRDVDEARAILGGEGAGRLIAQAAGKTEPDVVFMFPGQGAQHVNMARQLYEQEPTFRAHVDRCAEVLQPLLDLDLRTLLYPEDEAVDHNAGLLTQTRIAQPAIFVVEYALAQLWMAWGIRPKAMIGHSVGEYVAACLAGVITVEDALRVLVVRGGLMQEMPPGTMLAVRLPEEQVQRFLDEDLSLAACNTPSLCVVSGPSDRIEALSEQLAQEGIDSSRLHTSHAFHSAMMEPVVAPFTEALSDIPLQAPGIPFISSLTGTWVTDEEAKDPAYWAAQLRRPVQFSRGVFTLQKDPGYVLLEVGPGRALSTAAKQHGNKGQPVITSQGHPKEPKDDYACLLEALGRLWLANARIDWAGFYQHEQRRRLVLPTYPFERKRYWVDPPRPPIDQPMSANLPSVVMQPVSTNEGHTASVAMENGVGLTAPVVSSHAPARNAKILKELQEILFDLSGIEFEEDDVGVTFIEMGLDSLFLTQVSTALLNRFDIKIRFRRLMEDVDTLQALTAYLDEELPPDVLAEPPAPLPVEQPSVAAQAAPVQQPPAGLQPGTPQPLPAQTMMPIASTGVLPENAGMIERVIHQQLQVMAHQLGMLGGGTAPLPAAVSPVGVGTTAAPPLPAPAPAPPATQPAPQAGQDDGKREAKKKPKAFGAQARIDVSSDVTFTPRQQACYDRFIERYLEKTRASKEFTQRHRAKMSDPRAVTGFRPIWKELVYPIVVDRSSGAKLWDLDGNEYVDVTSGFGSNFLGNQPSFLTDAIEAQVRAGYEIGPQHPLTADVTELVCELTGVERVAFCNTGSEAVMGAMRITRTVTGRKTIVIFANSYHGIFDEVIVRGTKKLRSIAAAPGILASSVENVLVLEYGAQASLDIIRERARELAAVMIEPVQSRNPALQPKAFIHEVRKITEASGTALIFDEVITGFRIRQGGAQEYFGVRADVVTYGKIIGGGLPFAAIAGKTKWMDALDGGYWQYGDDSVPEAGVTYFAGTFVRHPLALAAAKASLEHLKQEGPALQQRLNERSTRFVEEMNAYFERVQAPISFTNFGSLCRVTVSEDEPFGSLLYYWLRDKGVHIWEGFGFFFTTAHTDDDIALVVRAFQESVRELQEADLLSGTPERGTASHPDPFGAEAPADLERIPLTEAQQEIWLASQMGDVATCAYNESFTLDLRGALQLEHLRQAIQIVNARHEAIHLRFSPDGAYQVRSTPQPLDIPLLDLSGLDPAERAARLADLYKREVTEPFDLVHGPLLQVKILKAEDEHHILLSTAHHIVFDGWSAGVYLDEVGIVYSALCQGTAYALPPAPRFSDYARDEAAQHQHAEGIEALRYWTEQFADPPMPLHFPTDRPRPATKSYRGASIHWKFNPAVYQAAKKTAAAQRTTLYALLLAAYKVMLYRLTGQNDLVVGIPTAGQSAVDEYSLIGHCVNILPLRSRLEGNSSFSDFLATTKTLMLDAQEHQACTFGALLRNLNLPRDPGRSPLVEVIFNLNRKLPGEAMHGLTTAIEENPKRAINWDMFLNLNETQDTLTVDWEYNSDLFDEDTIQRWIGHFERLLEAIAADPSSGPADLNLLTPAQREQLLVEWNTAEAVSPGAPCIHQLVEAQVARTPDADALVFEDERLTYRELNVRANRVAHHLRTLGVGPDVLVGLCMERSVDLVIGMLGILKAGGAYVPLDPAYPRERLAFMLADTQAPVVVTQEALRTTFTEQDVRLVCLDAEEDALQASSEANPDPLTAAQNLAYVIYTSGSTGRPKGVSIEHQNTGALLAWAATVFGPEALSGVLAATSVSFDLSVFELFLPLSRGGTVILVKDALHLPTHAAVDEVTLINTVPSVMTELLRMGALPPSVRTVNLAGEPLQGSLVDSIYEHASIEHVYDLYGPSEDTTYSTYARRTVGGAVTIGRPIAGTVAYVLDSRMHSVPVGVPGELYLGGAGVARGYLQRAGLTAERFVPDPFRTVPGARLYKTGDLVRYRPDGTLVYLGRVDHQVKIRGFRIELGEIEAALNSQPGVETSVVTVYRDEAGEERLVGYVMPRSDEGLSERALQDALRKHLPDFMVPAAFVFMKALPMTTSGKVDRQALPAPGPSRPEADEAFVGPRTPLEKKVAAMWRAVLRVDDISVYDDFFRLGGHSLLAVRVITGIKEELDVELPLGAIFETPTIATLAQRIEALRFVANGTVMASDVDHEEFEL